MIYKINSITLTDANGLIKSKVRNNTVTLDYQLPKNFNVKEYTLEVIGVRFRSTKKIYYFSPNGLDIKKNDNVVVETSRGIEFGQTVIGIRNVPEDEIVQRLAKAREEIPRALDYDYIIINDIMEDAAGDLLNTIVAEKNRSCRKKWIIDAVLGK